MDYSGFKGLIFSFGLRFALFIFSAGIIFRSLYILPEGNGLFNKWLLFSVIVFFMVLLFNASIVSKKNIISLDKGQIRRSITIVFTLVYLITLFTLPDEKSPLYKHYDDFKIIYGTIIAFYFGSRALEKRFK